MAECCQLLKLGDWYEGVLCTICLLWYMFENFNKENTLKEWYHRKGLKTQAPLKSGSPDPASSGPCKRLPSVVYFLWMYLIGSRGFTPASPVRPLPASSASQGRGKLDPEGCFATDTPHFLKSALEQEASSSELQGASSLLTFKPCLRGPVDTKSPGWGCRA